jgi:hypothetical protein
MLGNKLKLAAAALFRIMCNAAFIKHLTTQHYRSVRLYHSFVYSYCNSYYDVSNHWLTVNSEFGRIQKEAVAVLKLALCNFSEETEENH